MTPEQFVYWLQGFMEIANPKELLGSEVKIIKDHLDLVFTKVTPDYNKIEDLLKQPLEIKDFTQNPQSPLIHPDWTYRPGQIVCC